MSSEIEAPPASKAAVWAGRIISALIIAFMLMGSAMNLSKSEVAVKGLADQGYPAESGVGIGIALLVSTLLYAFPRTAVLGAILLTGYLGGAVATHVRSSEPFLIPVVFGVLVWLALVLRYPRLRTLLPFDRNA